MDILTLRPNGITKQTIQFQEPTERWHWQILSDGSDDTYVYDTSENQGPGLWSVTDWLTFPEHTTETGAISNVTINVRGKIIAISDTGNFFLELHTNNGSTYAGSTAPSDSQTITTISAVLPVVEETGLPFTWANIDTLQARLYLIEDPMPVFDDIYAYDIWLDIAYSSAIGIFGAAEKDAYNLLASVNKKNSTWFSEITNQAIKSTQAGGNIAIFRNLVITPAPNAIFCSWQWSKLGVNNITAGNFHYGLSPAALIFTCPATITGGTAQATITGLTSGVNYFVQFRPTIHTDYALMSSGIIRAKAL